MKVIGLTGGIASGKTTVADMLAARGAALIDTDLLAREIVLPGQPAYQDIAAAWPHVIQPDGAIDRNALGAAVFGDKPALDRLNAMTHPRIRALMLERVEALRNAETPPPAVILVIPLLFENGLEQLVEESWLVAINPELQRARLIERNGYTPEEADARIASQMSLDDKLDRATRVLWNNHDRWVLARAVDEAWLAAGLSP